MASDRSIEIIKDNAGRWIVARVKPDELSEPGSKVTWTLDPEKYPDVSAHFQFDADKYLEGTYMVQREIDGVTDHWTAEILKGQGTLTLTIEEKANRRLNPRYYAVWVCDPKLKSGGTYAVGESKNPPPKIDIGP